MLELIPLLGEIIGFLPTAIKAGMDVSSIVSRARAAALASTVTPEQIAALQAELAALTTQLDEDPPSTAT